MCILFLKCLLDFLLVPSSCLSFSTFSPCAAPPLPVCAQCSSPHAPRKQQHPTCVPVFVGVARVRAIFPESARVLMYCVLCRALPQVARQQAGYDWGGLSVCEFLHN